MSVLNPASRLREVPAYGWFALSAALASSVGQTFFIGLFGGFFSQDLTLSSAELGYLYGSATLLSGLMMFWAGALADRLLIRHSIMLALAVLALGCVVIATSLSATQLWLGFFLVRFGGQGLTGHLAVVAAARYAMKKRGRSVAMASYGFIIAEASLPLLVAALLGRLDWQLLWWWAGLGLVMLAMPGLFGLARVFDGNPLSGQSSQAIVPAGDNLSQAPTQTRRQLLGQWRFVLTLPMVLSSAFVITALFLHMGALVEIKGWVFADIGASFVLFAICQALAAFVTGRLVDEFGSLVLLRFFLWPMALAVIILGVGMGSWGMGSMFALLGFTAGANGVISGAIWVELFGAEQLGLIRGVYTGFMVMASAVAPMALGQWLDLSLPLSWLAVMAIVWCVLLPQGWVALIHRCR